MTAKKLIEGFPKPLWRSENVSEFLGISESLLRSMVSKNEIPYIRIAKKIIRFDPQEIQDWIESKRAG